MKNSYAIRGTAAVCIIYMAANMIISPTACMLAAKEALQISAETVIPSLFPFIFCANVFIALGAARIMSRSLTGIMQPLFGVSGAGALALVLGVVSGYPIGAICASSLYETGECTKNEAERLLSFCNNSGPMFIIGAVGCGMLGNYKAGLLLYITHIISALLCGFILKLFGRKEEGGALPPMRDENDIKNTALDLGAAVVKSVNSILTIGGFVIIFAVFTAVMPKTPWYNYIYALLEITGGLARLTAEYSGFEILPLAAFFLAFSGISVLAQVSAIAMPSGLSVTPYVIGKIIQGIIAFVLTYAAIKIFPYSIAASEISVPASQYAPLDFFKYSISATALISLGIFAVLIVSELICRHEK